MRTLLGPMVSGVAASGLALLEFADRPMLETQLKIVERRFRARLEPGWTALHSRLQRELDAYFGDEAGQTAFTIPVARPGTPFQERVWDALTSIPGGVTTSYAALAAQIGQPSAAKAAARANGMNHLALVGPRHRGIASDGSPSGHGGGGLLQGRHAALSGRA